MDERNALETFRFLPMKDPVGCVVGVASKPGLAETGSAGVGWGCGRSDPKIELHRDDKTLEDNSLWLTKESGLHL